MVSKVTYSRKILVLSYSDRTPTPASQKAPRGKPVQGHISRMEAAKPSPYDMLNVPGTATVRQGNCVINWPVYQWKMADEIA